MVCIGSSPPSPTCRSDPDLETETQTAACPSTWRACRTAQAWPTHSTCLVRSVGKISFHATLGINSGARDVTRCALLCPAGVSPRRLWQRSDAFRVCCWRISRACLGSGSSIRMPYLFPRQMRFVHPHRPLPRPVRPSAFRRSRRTRRIRLWSSPPNAHA